MHVIRLCSGGGVYGADERAGRGLKEGSPGETDHFSVNLQQFLLSKMRGEKVSTSHFLPQIFQFNSIGPFNTLFMTHRKHSPYCIMGSGGRGEDKDADSLKLFGTKGAKSR